MQECDSQAIWAKKHRTELCWWIYCPPNDLMCGHGIKSRRNLFISWIFLFFQKREKKKESWVPRKNAKLPHLPVEWFTFISNSGKAYWPPCCYPSRCSCSTFFNLSDQRLVNKNHLCFCGEQTNSAQSYDNCKFPQNSKERNTHVLLLNWQRKQVVFYLVSPFRMHRIFPVRYMLLLLGSFCSVFCSVFFPSS